MKSRVLLTCLLGSIAFAEMKPRGTFVPSRCGYSQSGEVCMGRKEGMKGTYVSVAVQRSMPVVYRVVKQTPVNGGFNPAAGAVVLNLVSENNQKAEATVRTMNGKEVGVTVLLPGGFRVSVGELQMAFVTM